MTTVLLVRHGLTAMTGPVLAGWTPGVHRCSACASSGRVKENISTLSNWV